MFKSLTFTDWLEAIVAFVTILGVITASINWYLHIIVKDLKQEFTNKLDKDYQELSLKIYKEEEARKDDIQNNIENSVNTIVYHVENTDLKINSLNDKFEYFQKEYELKHTALKEKIKDNQEHILSLIDSIESYLEKSNGYRRRHNFKD